MRRRVSGGRAALRPPGERSGGTGPAAGRRPVRRRASGEQVHCARPETVGGSGPATGRRPARRREPGDRAHSARPANGRVSRAGLGPTAGGGDEQSAIRHTVPARRAVRCGETGSRRSGPLCPPGERPCVPGAVCGRAGYTLRQPATPRPPGKPSSSPDRQRAGGLRGEGERPRRSCASRPAREVRWRARAGGVGGPPTGVRKRGHCPGPAAAAARARSREAERGGDDVAHARPRPEAACLARCRCQPARVRRIPDSASRPVHPIRLEQVASSRGRGHRVAEKASLRCSPLGRRRCTVAVPREERARAVVETGPRGRHGATQEPHSAPAQDA